MLCSAMWSWLIWPHLVLSSACRISSYFVLSYLIVSHVTFFLCFRSAMLSCLLSSYIILYDLVWSDLIWSDLIWSDLIWSRPTAVMFVAVRIVQRRVCLPRRLPWGQRQHRRHVARRDDDCSIGSHPIGEESSEAEPVPTPAGPAIHRGKLN